MDLKDIASVSGKSGLFKVVKPTRTGVILETVDESKSKLIANANTRVSLLKEISIYTEGKESSIPLEDVFSKIFEKHKSSLNVNAKSTPEELTSFLEDILPEYDKEKVYYSDIKKLVSWYSALVQYFPERFATKVDKEQKPTEETVVAESVTEGEKKAPKKTKAKKA